MPKSSLQSQNPHCNPKIHTVIPGSIRGSQDLHWNLNIGIRIQGSILECQYAHCHLTIYITLPGSTLKFYDLHNNLWIHIEMKGSTLKYQNPHWSSGIHTEILWSILKSQDLHLNFTIRITITGSTVKHQDTHWCFRIHTRIFSLPHQFCFNSTNLKMNRTSFLEVLIGNFWHVLSWVFDGLHKLPMKHPWKFHGKLSDWWNSKFLVVPTLAEFSRMYMQIFVSDEVSKSFRRFFKHSLLRYLTSIFLNIQSSSISDACDAWWTPNFFAGTPRIPVE